MFPILDTFRAIVVQVRAMEKRQMEIKTRVYPDTYEKFVVMAERESRSVANMLRLLVERCVADDNHARATQTTTPKQWAPAREEDE